MKRIVCWHKTHMVNEMLDGWRLGTDVYLGLYIHALGAQKMSNCPPHAHRCCVRCAAEAASVTTAIVTERTSNNWASWPHSICTLSHFLHLLALHNSSQDPMSYEHYNRMIALTTSVITRLQCTYKVTKKLHNCRLITEIENKVSPLNMTKWMLKLHSSKLNKDLL